MPAIGFLNMAVISSGILLLARLKVTGLDRLYPWFSAFLLTDTVLRTLSVCLPVRSAAYASFYYFTEPVIWLCCLMMAAESISALLYQYPAVATVLRGTLVFSTIAAMVVSLGSIWLVPAPGDLPGDLIERYMLLERVFHSGLLVLLIIALPALALVIVPLPRRVTSVSAVLVFFLSCKTGLLFVRSIAGPSSVESMTVALHLLLISCYAAWGLLLTPESAAYPARNRVMPVSETRLMAQLESLSLALTRVSSR